MIGTNDIGVKKVIEAGRDNIAKAVRVIVDYERCFDANEPIDKIWHRVVKHIADSVIAGTDGMGTASKYVMLEQLSDAFRNYVFDSEIRNVQSVIGLAQARRRNPDA